MSSNTNTHRCKIFDDSAHGYIRADAIGGLYMSSLYETVDGERVKVEDMPLLGTCAASVIMHNGCAMSTMGPHAPSQQELI